MPQDNPSVGRRVFSRTIAKTLCLHRIFISRVVGSALIVLFLLAVMLFGAFSGFARPQTAIAQAPNTTLNFQARILNLNGSLVPDGDYHIEFKIYDTVSSGGTAQGACSGNCLWMETRTGGDVIRVVNGYVSANLGSVTSFPSNMPWGNNLYVTMRVGGAGGSPSWDAQEMTNSGNRMKMSVAPVAFVANNVASGSTNSASTNSSTISIQSGNALGTTSNSGNITIDSGTATGTTGTITLGATNASALTLGRSGLTTTNTGALTVTQALTASSTLTLTTLGTTDNSTFICRNTSNILAGCNYTPLTNSLTDNITDAFDLQEGTNNYININTTNGSENISFGDGITINQSYNFLGSGTLTVAGNTQLNGNLTVAAGKYIALTGGNTASRPGSPTEGMVYFDSTTDSLLAYANGKWQSDRGEFVVVAANDSSQAEKDSADYVADGTADQTEINSALTEATGGKVILLAGTYVANATILVPNNTTLAGAGTGTIIQLDVGAGTDNLIEATGASRTGQIIRDLALDGSLGTGGSQVGIYFDSVGAGTGGSARQGGRIENVTATDFVGNSISLNASLNNTITGNTATNNTGAAIYLSASSNNNTITNNKIQGGTSKGIEIVDTSYNIITGNTIEGMSQTGILVYNSYNTVVSGNVISANDDHGINVTYGSNNTVTGNTLADNLGVAILVNGSSVTVSGNNISNPGQYGVQIFSSGSSSTINGNIIENSGGASDNNAIATDAADFVSITNNTITDSSCNTTCYAINISNSTSDKNYLEGNRYSDTDADSGDDATINDAGTGTIYAGQQTNTVTSNSVSDFRFRGSDNSTTAFAIQNAAGTSVFNVNTSTAGATVTGTLGVTGNTTLTGDLAVNGNDITTGAGDLTITPAGGDTIVTGTLAVTTLGSADTSTFVCRNTSNQLATCSSSPLTNALTDNVNDAFDLQEGTNNYINISTLDAGSNISFGNATTNPSFSFLGSGALTVNGASTFNSSLTAKGQLLADGTSANQTQLIVRANAGQTVANPLVLLQNSSSVELARINATTTSLYFGNAAGGSSAAGVNNTGIGASALGSVSTGTGNTTLGSGALASVSVGENNVALGYQAANLTTGSNNTALGTSALLNNTGGNANVAVGLNALYNSTSSDGVAVGTQALEQNTSGYANVAVGKSAGQNNQTGSGNALFGYYAGAGVATNSYSNNSIFGTNAGSATTTGSNNILFGYEAGNNITSGSNNIIIGYDLDASSATVSNELRIGGILQGSTSTLAAQFNGSLDVVGSFSSPYGGLGISQNLLQGSEKMDDDFFLPWVHTQLTSVTNGATAPNSEATADTIVTNAAGANTHILSQTYSTTTNGNYNFSIWVRATSGTEAVRLRIDSTAATPTTGTPADFIATTGWQRINVTQNFTGTPSDITANLIITDDTSTVEVWGAQLRQGTAPGIYTQTEGAISATATPALTVQGDVQIADGGTILIGTGQDCNNMACYGEGLITNFGDISIQASSSEIYLRSTAVNIGDGGGGTGIRGFLDIWDGSGNNVTIQVDPLASDYDITIPTITGNDTFCLLSLNNCAGTAVTLQSAYTNDADGSNAVIALTAADGAVVLRDAASTIGDLFVIEANGGTDYLTVSATGTTINGDLSVTAGNYISLAGGNTASRPGSPTEGMIYFDTDTDSLLTYANGKWQSDRGEYIVVAANDSTQVEKDSADYVADGTADEVEINAALTAGAGGKVILLPGTYVAAATILIPNNTTLAGSGPGTVIELGNLDATENLIENSDTTTGTGIIIRDIKLDGRNDLNTTGTQYGISFNTASSSRIENVYLTRFRNHGIYLQDSSNNNAIDKVNITAGSGDAGVGIDASDYNMVSSSYIVGASGQDNGVEIVGGEYNTVNGNTFAGPFAERAIYMRDGAILNTVSANTVNGTAILHAISSESNSGANIITGNTIFGTTGIGIVLNFNSDANTVTNNSITLPGTVGIYAGLTSDNNTIDGNTIVYAGGSTDNDGITVDGDGNQITDNYISDSTCSSTCYAIEITSNADNTYISGNMFSASSGTAIISNGGTATTFANQSISEGGLDTVFRQANSTTAFAVQNTSGTSVFNVNTSTAGVTASGTLDVSGLTTLSGGLTVETGDTLTFNGDAFTDFTGGGLVNTGGVLSVDTTSATGFFQNGGNDFGGNATLGTNTAGQTLTLETANSARFIVDSAASTLTGQGATTLTSSGTLTVSSATTNALTIDSGTTGAINIGTGANAKTLTLGSATGTAITNIQAGTGTAAGDLNVFTTAGGIINIGNNAVNNKVLNLGSTGTTAAASTVNIATTNFNGTQAVNIGNTTSANNVVFLQGGTSSTAIRLAAGANGTITVGSQTAANTVSIGTVGAAAFSSTVNIGTSTGAAQTVVLGSTSTTSTTTIAAGSGNINFNATQAQFSEVTGTRTLTVQTRTTNVAGSGLTVQAGTAGTGASAFAGGVLTLQGGAAAGTGNANGGNVVISAGTGVGTGVKGLVVIDTATFSASVVQNFTGNANITQANIDSLGSILISGDIAGRIATLTDPTTTTAGRVVYVTNTGSVDITLAANTVGVALSLSLKPATTATMYWNGVDWTAAGASSSTDLQAAYNNTASSAGAAELVLKNTSTSNGLTVRNGTSTDEITGGLFEVQTSIGSNIFTVNNNATEYATNGGAETAGASAATFPATTWDTTTGGTIDRYNSTTGGYDANNVGTGQASVRMVTTTTNHGARNRISTSLTSGLTYTVSYAVRGATNFATLQTLYSPDGTTAGTTTCATAQTVTSGQWTRISCTFVASGTITSSNSILIRQTDATGRTFYIDNLSVNVNASANFAGDGTADNVGAFATNWGDYEAGAAVTVAQETSVIYEGSASARAIITPATANVGIRNNMAITPAISTQFLVSFYARSTTTVTGALAVGFLPAGGTGAPTGTAACVDYNTQSLVANTWTKITCLFTTPSSGISNPDLVIYQTDTAARTIYVDALSITLNTNNSNNVQIGGGNKGGPATLFTLDRSASAPIADNNDAYLGSMYYNTTTGRIQCYEADGWGACGAAPDNIVNLNPEYAGAVLNGTGVGTMTADFCAEQSGVLNINTSLCDVGQAKNYYKWTSPQATQQTYSIYVTYQLPATFNGFSSDDTVQLVARTDSLANAAVTYEMFKSTGSAVTACGTETTVVTTADTWQSVGINGNESTGCSFNSSSASNFIIFKINLKANSNANAYVSTLSFTTTGR